MKVRIIGGHSLGNGIDVFPGEVHELSEHVAHRKIHQGFAVAVPDNTPLTQKESTQPEEVVASPEPAIAAEPPQSDLGDPSSDGGEESGDQPEDDSPGTSGRRRRR